MHDEDRTITLSHHAKTRNYLVHLGFQHLRNCTSQLRYFSGNGFQPQSPMQLCLPQLTQLPEGTIDIEVTIQTVDSMHTYQRDRTIQAA